MAAARVIVHSLRTSEWSGELDSVFFGRSLVRITGSSDAGICLNSHVLFTPSYLGGRVSFLYLFEYLRAVYLHPISKRYIIGPVFFQYQAQIHVERKTVLKEYKTGSVTHVARCLFLVRYAVISSRPGLISYQEMTPSRDHESLRT